MFARRCLPLLPLALLLAAGCSSSGDSMTGPETEGPPAGYPEVPRPAHVDDFDVPDQSEIYDRIEPIEGTSIDFAPIWTAATFTWDIDIQTVYQTLTATGWEDDADPWAHYWSGTRPSSGLVFEGGVVDLRHAYDQVRQLRYTDPARQSIPKRIMLAQDGSPLEEPFNPHLPVSQAYFDFGPDWASPDIYFDPPIWIGIWDLKVEDGAFQRYKKRLYHVSPTAASPLAEPVYMLRERFWRRVLVDDTKSVRVDPGNTKSVSFTRTTGMSYTEAESFAETIDVTVALTPFNVGTVVTESTTETHERSSEIQEQESTTVTHEVSGIEGKTIIFSVWESVERYSFCDVDGDPYTDPNYTFEDIGYAEIQGDHQILQSAIFEHEDGTVVQPDQP